MTKPVRLLIVGLVLLIALSGCHGPGNPSWVLTATGHTVEEGEEVRFLGNVRLDGMHDNTTVSGIKVEFRDANGTLLRTVQVGTFRPGRDRAELNETFDGPPEFVLVKVESIDTPKGYGWTIEGLERDKTGEYPEYTDYDPFVGTATAGRRLVA